MKQIVLLINKNQIIMSHPSFGGFISFDVTNSIKLQAGNGRRILKQLPKGQQVFNLLLGKNTNKVAAIVYIDGDIPFFLEKGLKQYLLETGLFQKISFMKRENDKFQSLDEEVKAYQARNIEER